MKAALAIAAAELRANRLALLAAIPCGLVCHLAVTSLPFSGLTGRHRSPSEAALLGFFAVTICQLCLAAYMGAAAVSRDLGERRLGFWFARPVSPLAYWGPKLAVGFFVAYVFGWLLIVPGLLAGSPGGSLVLAAIRDDMPVVAGAAATAFVVAAASAAAGAVRSRSGLLPLDVVMLTLTGAALVAAIGKSWEDGTSGVVLSRALPFAVAAAMLVVLGAGAAQVGLGRLDLRRGHAVLSAILWTGLLACVAGILVFSRVVANVTPADLRAYAASVEAAEDGTHVLLHGASRRWGFLQLPAFFLDEQGRFVRAGAASWVSGWAWSADGRRAAWSRTAFPLLDTPPLLAELAQSGEGPRSLRALLGLLPTLWVMSLDEPGAVPRVIARRGPELEGVSALSPSGQRLLIANRSREAKSILDVDGGATLASIHATGAWSNARFLSETLVRALREDASQVRIVDWDVAAGRLVERGAIAPQGERGLSVRFAPTQDWQRVLRLDPSGLFLHDLEGRSLATLVDGWPARRNRLAGLLSEGRFGSVEEGPDGLRLRVFDASGRPQLDARFKGRFPVVVGGESAPGVLALGVAPFQEDGARETLFVDLASGTVARREAGLWPALRRWQPTRRGGSETPAPGSLGTRLFLSSEGVVLLDPASGSRRMLAERRAS